MNAAVTTPEEKWPYLDVLGLVRRRKGRIALGVFAGVALAAAACAVIGPWYESRACLLVVRKPQGQSAKDYLSTHILVITSPKIVGRAVETGNLAQLPGLRGKDEPVREILDSLSVTRDPPKPGVVPSNEILNLSFRGRARDDCARVLGAIIASYQEFLKEEASRDRSAETLELRRAKDEAKKDLDAKQAAYRAFRQQNPLFAKGKDGKAAALLAIEDGLHRKGIGQAEALYNSIVKQLQEIDAVRGFGSFDTHVLAAPERGRWVVKKVLLVFGLGLLGGLLVGLAWVCLAEFTDKSFRAGRSRQPAQSGGAGTDSGDGGRRRQR